jgi:hypothetical protein
MQDFFPAFSTGSDARRARLNIPLSLRGSHSHGALARFVPWRQRRWPRRIRAGAVAGLRWLRRHNVYAGIGQIELLPQNTVFLVRNSYHRNPCREAPQIRLCRRIRILRWCRVQALR